MADDGDYVDSLYAVHYDYKPACEFATTYAEVDFITRNADFNLVFDAWAEGYFGDYCLGFTGMAHLLLNDEVIQTHYFSQEEMEQMYLSGNVTNTFIVPSNEGDYQWMFDMTHVADNTVSEFDSRVEKYYTGTRRMFPAIFIPTPACDLTVDLTLNSYADVDEGLVHHNRTGVITFSHYCEPSDLLINEIWSDLLSEQDI